MKTLSKSATAIISSATIVLLLVCLFLVPGEAKLYSLFVVSAIATGLGFYFKTLTLTKSIGLTFVSILIFLFVWDLGSQALFDKAADDRIATIRNTFKNDKATAEKAVSEELVKLYGDEDKGIAPDPTARPNSLPSPAMVLDAANVLLDDIYEVQKKKKEFRKSTEKINKKLRAEGKPEIKYTGRPSFGDMIVTSLVNIFYGVLLAISISVPLGILIGLSKNFRIAINWFVQVFKPISPVVWFLLVQMIVNTIMADVEEKDSIKFYITFISVGLCAMWATLVNTSVGVSSVDENYLNVAKVLRLSVGKKIFKVVLPSSIPLIFTGLRITVSVSWMVLIAVEWLSQSPGLGGFVREEFQNGSNSSNAKIMVAMLVIGVIGFFLDKIMGAVQGMMSFEDKQSVSPLAVIKQLFSKKKAA